MNNTDYFITNSKHFVVFKLKTKNKSKAYTSTPVSSTLSLSSEKMNLIFSGSTLSRMEMAGNKMISAQSTYTASSFW